MRAQRGAAGFDLTAFGLAVEAPQVRRARRPGCDARLARHADAFDQFIEPRQRRRPVHLLSPMLLRLDDHDAVARKPMIGQREQAHFQHFGQRRSLHIEAQVNGARDLVDVLAARSLRAHCGQFDFVRRDWIAGCHDASLNRET
jgi:hypothetical protein